MVDIVERLNDLYSLLDNSGSTDAIEAIMAEAAAEIQHLRAEVERLTRERAEAFDRAAQIAEKEGVSDFTNIYGGGPEWYRHGQRIAAAIRQAGKDGGAG